MCSHCTQADMSINVYGNVTFHGYLGYWLYYMPGLLEGATGPSKDRTTTKRFEIAVAAFLQV